MDKETKTALKNAREAIRKKEFKEALQHCKTVLKQDKNNYNAYVFIGVAAEGMDEPEQAFKAYRRATEISPEQPLAWQGLSGFYDKHDEKEYREHQLEVYRKLLEIHPGDRAKCFEVKLKIGRTCEVLKNYEEALSTYQELIDSDESEEAKLPVWKQFVPLLAGQKTHSSEQSQLLLCGYEAVLLAKNGQENEDSANMWTNYLKLLVKKRADYKKMQTSCDRMLNAYPEEWYPIEISLLLQLDQCWDSRGTDDFETLTNKLESLSPESSVLRLAQGYLSLQKKAYREAAVSLSTGLDSFPQALTCWLYLAESQVTLHDHDGVEKSVTKASKIAQKKDCFCSVEKAKLLQMLKLCQAKSLLDVGNADSVAAAVDLCQKLLEDGLKGEDVNVTLAYGYIALGEMDKAKEIVVKLPTSVPSLRGWLKFKQGAYDEAQQFVERAIAADDENGFYQYQLGRIFWSQIKEGDMTNKQECLNQLIKAAKLDPFFGETFLYLGHYYSSIGNDKQRACKCYQKAYDLKKTSDEVGIALVDCLNDIGQEDTALEILMTVTSQASAGSAKWAWLRLGLHYLKHNDTTAAVTSLQCALRADPSDSHCWECLAEAYMNRGSYTASLRAFTKATELNPDSLYSYYQIATIKQTLGLHAEAVLGYNEVLTISPDYVPALKGLGETLLHLARTALHQYFNQKAMDLTKEAIWDLTRAASQRPDLSCLWKLLGDACTLVVSVAPEVSEMEIPKKLTMPSASLEEPSRMAKSGILATGAKCYGRALKILPENSSLWYDLGVNYFHQSRNVSCEAESLELCQKSAQVLKKAISLDQSNYRFWNALGLVALSEGIDNVPLAQHCFIKSVQAENNNVVAWTNLGVLYFKNENIELAHEAFKVAQSVDPNYVQCWIGQALIAETVGHDDAMDLFRHSSGLSMHVESSVGYASWVCSALQGMFKLDKDLYAYCIERMGAIPAACDVLSKFCDRVHTNPTAYNMYGMLLERRKLFNTAASAYASAVELLEKTDDTKNLNKVRSNYARVLCTIGSAEEAIEQYKSISPLDDFHDILGLALSYYKAGKLEESFSAYTQAAELAASDEDKSHVYAALGMTAYKFNDLNGAKSALFQCSQTSKPSVPGLLALCSLGLQQSDSTLVSAVLQELNKLNDVSPENLANVTYLTASLYSLMGDPTAAKNYISKQVHLHPNKAKLWLMLSEYLGTTTPFDSPGACTCAKVALDKDPTLRGAPTAIVRGALAEGLFSTGDSENKILNDAQRAIILHPDSLVNRCNLLAVLYGETIIRYCLGIETELLDTVRSYSANLLKAAEEETRSNPSMESTAIHLWCVKYYILILMCSGKMGKSKAVTLSALSVYDDINLKALLSVIKGIVSSDCDVETQANFTMKLIAEWYISKGLMDEVEVLLKKTLQVSHNQKEKLSTLLQLQYVAFKQMTGRGNPKWSSIFMDAAAEVLRIDPKCSVANLMRGIVRLKQTGMRVAKRHFTDTMKGDQGCIGVTGSIADNILNGDPGQNQ